MKAVLLGAGRGTRLLPLTREIPKILAPLGGRALLDHQLEYLARNGVTEVALNVHHHAEQVRDHLARNPSPVPVRVSFERELLGTAGALVPLSRYLTEPFVVLYGDVVTDADLRELMAEHRRNGGLGTLAYALSDQVEGKGIMQLGPGGRIESFVEKPDAQVATPAAVNAGILALDPRIVELVPSGPADFGLDVWPRVLSAGERLFGLRIDGAVVDVGTAEGLALAERVST